jgi:hypothetical protein
MWCWIKADRLGAPTENYTGDARWCWSINTSPYPVPPLHYGVAITLDAAKQEFRTRYEEMKRMGVRPFS